jgi:arylsulfatase
MNGDSRLPGYRGFPQPNTVTIAEVLKDAGYHTSMVGKWHLSAGPKTPRPTDRGFEEFYGMIGGFNSCFQEDPFYTRLPAGRAKRSYPKDGFYSTDVFGDYALDFLAEARRRRKPFFQYLAFNAPHFPLHAKPADIQRYLAIYGNRWDKTRQARLDKQIEIGLFPVGTTITPLSPYKARADIGRSGMNPAWESLDAARRTDLARRMAVFAGMVTCMDRNIGRLVDDLRKNGELDNTLIMFLSDNGACAEWDPFGFDGNSGPNNILHKGPKLAEMGSAATYHSYGSGWANVGNTPFRLYKHYCHEGGIRTPFIAHWPRRIAAKGEFRDHVGHIIDVMATCVDIAKTKYPANVEGVPTIPMEGRSLASAFAGDTVSRTLFWEHENNKAIRNGRWKLVEVDDTGWELYDMEADITESANLADKMPGKVRELANAWNRWAKHSNVVPKPGRKK